MQWVATGGAATDAAIAQLTGDILADVVVADGVLDSGRALLLKQDPSGALLAPVSLLTGSGRGSEDLAVADIDGDGLIDIVINDGPSVFLQSQIARGTFDPMRPLR